MSKTAQKIDRHVGARIRKRRSELGLTQGDLGEAIGLSYQQIQKYETAISRCSAGKLYELAVALDVEISYFFDRADGVEDLGFLWLNPIGAGTVVLCSILLQFVIGKKS